MEKLMDFLFFCVTFATIGCCFYISVQNDYIISLKKENAQLWIAAEAGDNLGKWNRAMTRAVDEKLKREGREL